MHIHVCTGRWLNVDVEWLKPVPDEFRTTKQYCDPAWGYMYMIIGERRQRFEFALRFDPACQRIGCPVLVLHGGADPLVPEPGIQAPLAEAAGPRGQLRVWPDGEHTLYNHAAERDAIVADWFADHLLCTV